MRKYKVDESKLNGLEIAIVGMDCRMPGADNVREFWENIVNGKDSISFFTNEEMEESGIDKALYSRENYVKAKGIINHCDRFDNRFFNYTPEEVLLMDPQLRVIHECVYHGLEDAGYLSYQYKGEVGVFLGNFTNYSWLSTLSSGCDNAVQKLLLGSLNDINNFSSRVAYNLNLRGPAISVETACSTSLVAVHLACQSLLAGDCDMAVAGGVSITVPIKEGYLYEEGMIYSEEGHCHAFSKDADGSVFSDGAGVVVLKTLENAIRDNDNIYAVIKGSSINNDGSDKAGFSAPSVNGEARAVRSAMYAAQVSPEDIGYIETHGTATQIGDPIEIEALTKAFHTTKRNYCALGSVKTNIGHTNNAAGVAGIIKAALALKNKLIPASLHFSEPNDKIDFENSPFYVNTEAKEWKYSGKCRTAGVSAFGIGGTNAHVILEEAPEFTVEDEIDDVNCILLSAKSKKSLEAMTEQLERYIETSDDASIQDIAYTLNRRNGDYKFRGFFLGNTTDKKGDFLKKGKHRASGHIANENNKLVFVFPGQGSEYKDMMYDLYLKHSVFKENADKCAKILEELTEINFIDVLYSDEQYRSSEIQILIFVVEYALAKTLDFYGIAPDILLGYSFGEYVAACLSGVFTLRDALYIIVERGKLMKKLKGTSMLSVPLNENKIKEYLSEKLHLSIINEEACTVSGINEDLEEFENKLRDMKMICSKVPSAASHCALMRCIEDDFRRVLGKVDLGKCSKNYISGIFAGEVDARQLASADYWINHMLNPVRFSDSIKTVLDEYGPCTFVEVGPGMNVTALIKRFSFCSDERISAVNMTRNKNTIQDDYEYLLNKICLLWSIGHDINKKVLLWKNRKNYVNLPLYPFKGEKFKIAKRQHSRDKTAALSNVKKPLNLCLYSMNWKKQRFIDCVERSEDTYIIFCDSMGCGEIAAQKIGSEKKVYLVRKGDEFTKCGDGEYVIDSASESDYELLVRDISEPKTVYNVLNFMCLDNIGDRENKLENSFFGLLYFVKSFQKENLNKENSLKICSLAADCYSIKGTENIDPYNSGVIGLGVVISQEYPAVKTKCVELETKKFGVEKIASLMLEEASVYDEKIVAYRRNSRYFPSAEQMYAPNSYRGSAVKDGDTVLIIGGMGNVGLSLAQGISSMKKVNFVLTSTHELALNNGSISSEKEGYISEIERNGSTVMVKKCNVKEDLSSVLDSVISTLGKINTVIFAAGVISSETFALIENTTKEMCNMQFDVKIRGLESFAETIKKYNVDNCILTSSVSGILGGIGHSAYSVSNLFMDFFAKLQNKNSNTRWTSVAWDFWQFNTNRKESYVGTAAKKLALSRDEGMRLVPMIFGLLDEEQIIISTGDLMKRYDDWVNIAADKELNDEVEYKRPELSNRYTAPTNETEEKIVEIWEKILGYKGIGIEDNFFELGGDSLKEVEFSIQLKKQMNLEISLADFFNHPFIKDIALLSRSGEAEEKAEEYQEDGILPVSLEQKRMYMLHMTDKKSLAYNTSLCMVIEGEFDEQKLEAAFRSIVNENSILLSNYFMDDDVVVQKIDRSKEFHLETCQISPEEMDHFIDEFIHPFDLENDSLIRAGVAEIDVNKHILIIDLHHIVADGISVELIKQQLVSKYFGNESAIGEHRQYIDYIHWQEHNIKNGKFDIMQKYWEKQFAGEEIPQIEWPVEKDLKIVKEHNGKSSFFRIENKLFEKLKELSARKNITLYMLLMASYSVLLHKMTSQEEFIVGMPISCRDNESFSDVVGLMINTLPIKTKLNGNMKFEDFLDDICKCCLDAFENKSYQYDKIIENIAAINNLGENSLYDTILVMQNMKKTHFNYQGWRISDYEIKRRSTKVAISFEFAENSGSLQCRIEYDGDLFSEKVLNRFIKGFIRVFEKITETPKIEIKNIEIIDEELSLLLRKDRYIPHIYDENYTLMDMLHEQFEASANCDAIYSKGTVLTYSELDNITNLVAANLIKVFGADGKHDITAGILSDRTYKMIVLIIAFWKAGIAYTPFEAAMPEERFRYILSDSKAVTVVCTDDYFDRAKVYCVNGLRCISYSSLTEGYDNSIVYSAVDQCSAERSAYIIYTSGTTGKPKGVLIRHNNIVNSMLWRKEEFGLGNNDRVLQMFSFLFDGFVVSFLQPLVSGSVLHVIGDERANDIPSIARYIAEYKITHICTVPPLFGAITECLNDEEMQYLRLVSLAGDKLKKEVVDSAKKKNPGLEVCNEYGPTEASVVVSCHRDVSGDNCNILGKPIYNTHLLVLDNYLKLCNINVPGQLCLSGKGIASGYLNMPELSREKFVPSPYFENETMYLTGDVARITEEGEIEFIGRKDSQIKIHGFRIEIDEITKALFEMEGIDDVSIVARDEGREKYLCAFYVANKDLKLFELQQYLYKKLPSYMVPAYFIRLDALPLTPIGKIDEKTLRSMPIDTSTNSTKYVPPTNELENELAVILGNIFKSGRIGIDTSFFDMGGNSLNIVKLHNEIRKRHEIDLPITVMYKYPTVRMLAEYLNNMLSGNTAASTEEKETELNDSAETFANVISLFGEDNFE